MAEIYTNSESGNRVYVKKRPKRHSTHIDMTPMVDLMSLLITFFMLTTAFSKAKIMEIILPEKDTSNHTSIDIPAPRTLNLILSGDNTVYYYLGKPPLNSNDVVASIGRLHKTDYSKDGIRKLVLKRNILLYEKIDSLNHGVIAGKSKISQDSMQNTIKLYKKQDNDGPIVLIKADKKAKYRNLVDAIDEMVICNVARYAVVEPNEYELKLVP